MSQITSDVLAQSRNSSSALHHNRSASTINHRPTNKLFTSCGRLVKPTRHPDVPKCFPAKGSARTARTFRYHTASGKNNAVATIPPTLTHINSTAKLAPHYFQVVWFQKHGCSCNGVTPFTPASTTPSSYER